jgi:hypothetical protein
MKATISAMGTTQLSRRYLFFISRTSTFDLSGGGLSCPVRLADQFQLAMESCSGAHQLARRLRLIGLAQGLRFSICFNPIENSERCTLISQANLRCR